MFPVLASSFIIIMSSSYHPILIIMSSYSYISFSLLCLSSTFQNQPHQLYLPLYPSSPPPHPILSVCFSPDEYNLFPVPETCLLHETMPGRLKSCWSEWSKLQPSRLVCSIIQNGYSLQWKDNIPPPPLWRKNHPSILENREYVLEKISEVESMNIISECQQTDLHCILGMKILPKPSSLKKRLILDGSPLKPYELRRTFKMEHLWLQGREIFSDCTHGGIIDLSNAFYHIDLANDSKQYLGFECFGKFYRYNSMPQGIHSAPFIFTEVTKPVVTAWRIRGIRVLKFLDDFPMGASTFLTCRLHIAFMLEHLISLGWLVAMPKLIGYPNPQVIIPALGTEIHFSTQKFHLAESKLQEIFDLILSIVSSRKTFVKSLARLAGLLVSRSHCLGPAARIRTRSMYANLEDRLSSHELSLPNKSSIGWSRHISCSTDTLLELQFWLHHLRRVNGQPFQRSGQIRVIEADLDTDAGGQGWGGVLYLPPGAVTVSSPLLLAAQLSLPPGMSLQAIHSALHDGLRVCGKFTIAEMSECSNVRELLANLYTLQTLSGFLTNMRVDRRLDNAGAVQALGGIIPSCPNRIFGGSSQARIQSLVVATDDFCLFHNIDCHTIWVPRSLNSAADAMAKICTGDHFSYTLRPNFRDYVENSFGIHTIDRFASRNNVQVCSGRYNSKFFEPEALWLNAFTCHWRLAPSGLPENNWIHPPYNLIGQVCLYLLRCEAIGTVILPVWPSAPWWPDVAPLLDLHPFLELGFSTDVLTYPPDVAISTQHLPRGRLLALRLDL
jgi:hypothetical protein